MSHGQLCPRGGQQGCMSLKCGALTGLSTLGTAIGSCSLVSCRALSSRTAPATFGVARTNAQPVLIVARWFFALSAGYAQADVPTVRRISWDNAASTKGPPFRLSTQLRRDHILLRRQDKVLGSYNLPMQGTLVVMRKNIVMHGCILVGICKANGLGSQGASWERRSRGRNQGSARLVLEYKYRTPFKNL